MRIEISDEMIVEHLSDRVVKLSMERIEKLMVNTNKDDDIEALRTIIDENLIPKKRLLTQKEACTYLNISAGTMNHLVKKQEIHPVIPLPMDGKTPRPKYDVRDLDKYIERYKIKNIKCYKQK
ncbi:helix-turn-helix domain-containing protein [Vagococcus fluvialis]|uniref:helix-turn-helix domain-containing protein n=1 Tax=Vagococcus fluvialis TaxID=2738 RepID=UPI003B5B5B4F